MCAVLSVLAKSLGLLDHIGVSGLGAIAWISVFGTD
jgi:hypothetical protein